MQKGRNSKIEIVYDVQLKDDESETLKAMDKPRCDS